MNRRQAERYLREEGFSERCRRPPRGWWCSAEANHDGPCPTRPDFWAHPIWWLRTNVLWKLA